MKKILSLFGAMVILMIAFSFVDFHSSMTKVDYNPANGVLRFTTKMNTADLQKALNVEAKNSNFSNVVRKYVDQNFSASVNGSPLRLTFTGGQEIGESMRVYFEASGVKNIQTITIRNSILLNDFPNQMNIVNVDYKGQQRTMTLRRGRESDTAKF